MRTSEVLNRAADLIERRGWLTGSYDAAREGICLESAIAFAHNGTAGLDAWLVANECPAGRAVREYLGMAEWGQESSTSLWVWNDSQGAATAVIEVLRATALIEAAKEDDTLATEFLAWQSSEVSA